MIQGECHPALLENPQLGPPPGCHPEGSLVFLLGTAPTGSPHLIIVRLFDDCDKIDTIGRRWHGCAETHKAAHGGMRLDRLPLGKGIWPFPCPVQKHKGTYPRKSIATDSARGGGGGGGGGGAPSETPPALFENPEAPPHRTYSY